MAKSIMFQGTSSCVGKSILTTALCRILKNEGIKVTPFKSQNMTRNAVNIGGNKRIAGSQVVQAEAAKIEPMSEMNPILLMPNSDVGCDVVINGELHRGMVASEYQEKKKEFKNLVKESYNKLDSIFDVIVIEGAGSPAEINLRENDLVNMGLAELVNASVILIGDIDRGGVFASLYGTVMLMSEEERKRVKGFIVNKFRGDIEILKPGLKMMEDLIDRPCLGVIPYTKLNIEEEDSLVDGKRSEKIEDDDLRDKEYDRLADVVKSNLNLEAIKKIMGM
ncbi:cobyric acid synthase CobQ [Gottschalkia purinilytica]|uniref:Cobyric acid synthase n=1 Tax=Gottschalkia purinilytica TaxID=1503 RepID=A0A0L0W8W0_GOTPU|nr:cobyric acid synthase [Gottschalkia purinilytica]KNF07897.1 cobyric acid synthase CobQ [Gottschalkia purinilytica]